VVALAEPRSESPPETRLRVALVRAGLPVPAVQHVVVAESGFTLARVALAYPAARLALEYDGAPQLDARRARLDRLRDAELTEHGWQTLRLVPDDLDDLPRTVRRVRLLLAARGRMPW
jgi:very-short-patch-repair endonuclease